MTSLNTLDPNPSGSPAVLLLHGLGADSSSWTLQIPALIAAGYRPLAPDLPGFGSSLYDGRGWTIRRVAGLLVELLDELGTGPAHIVGLSLGGVIAQQIALDSPHSARKLVLVSTFAALHPQGLGNWTYFIQRSLTILAFGMNSQARVVAGRVFPNPQDEPLRELYLATVSKADPRAYTRAMLALGLFDSRRRLKEINIPTLIVTGSEDTTVTPDRQRTLLNGIPQAKQVLLPHAGHAVSVDQSELFNRVVLDFLI